MAILIPNPIRKVLSTIQRHDVQALLMGGQACVLYGAAEFSRDTDLAILCTAQNLAQLDNALTELQANVIAVPPFTADYLERGHAIHFRCAHPDAANLWVDIMSRMRGVDSFDALWERRTTFELDGITLDLLALPDLVAAKKTQRDKDWPMIRRLLEAHYLQFRETSTSARIQFWLQELRTPSLLQELANQHPQEVNFAAITQRPLLQLLSANVDDIETALRDEEEQERQRDKAYWQPLKQELERLRHPRVTRGK